jgi:hypothetical protein
VELSLDDREALLQAKLVLEKDPGLAAKIADVIGRPIERGIANLPLNAQRAITAATHAALRLALHAAVSTLSARSGGSASPTLHKVAAGVAGAVGGFFGLPALLAELPISTLIILRAIADVARSQGEDMGRMEARLACLEVLGLGTDRSRVNGAAETGYYAARIGLTQSVTHAAEHIAKHGLTKKIAPPVAELLARVASRFSTRVSEQLVAKAIPLVGAASGAAINTLFTHHFQEMAKAHFTVRRLERSYGASHVQRAYEGLRWDAGGGAQEPDRAADA